LAKRITDRSSAHMTWFSFIGPGRWERVSIGGRTAWGSSLAKWVRCGKSTVNRHARAGWNLLLGFDTSWRCRRGQMSLAG
jgi:hypothetical protein